MPTHPNKLLIVRNWRSFLAQFWLCLISYLPIMYFVEDPNWQIAAILCLLGFLCVLRLLVGFFRTFVVIDDKGVSWLASSGLETSRCEWRQIEACACKNESGQRILRIFLRQSAEKTPTDHSQDVAAPASTRYIAPLVIKPWGRKYMDINFNLAEKPEQSLDIALQACARWIIAMRESSITGSPIRDFGELPPSESKKMADDCRLEAWVAGLAIVSMISFVIMLVFLISR
jgi:hypothetical protein